MKSLLLLGLAASAALVACGSHSSSSSSSSAALDVRQVCDERAAWTRTNSSDCSLCVTDAPAPTCGCPTVTGSSAADVVAKCLSQAQAKGAEPDCTGVDRCVDDCRGDCACADGCFTGHDTCRKLASELDTCILQTCDSRCR